MGFKDLVIEREFDNNDGTPYKIRAILLHTNKALESFKSKYDLSLTSDDIPIEKWFICSYRDDDRFDKKLVERIEPINEFIEDSTNLLLSLVKEIDWARKILI